MPETAPVIAAIDLGTNSFHLAVASVDSRGMLNIIEKDKEAVRLGSSSKDMKFIQPDGFDRAINTLKRFAKLAHANNAQIRALATSAIREAENRDLFIQKAAQEAGVKIEVISGNEEGRLIYKGVLHALPLISTKTLLIDIGGGSTETLIGKHGNVEFVHSAKLGAIRLTKAFFPGC